MTYLSKVPQNQNTRILALLGMKLDPQRGSFSHNRRKNLLIVCFPDHIFPGCIPNMIGMNKIEF